VRLGIRAQLVLWLGALLLLALVPLFLAVANLTRASLDAAWQRNARALGRAIAGHVNEARRSRPAELDALLDAQVGQHVGAIGLYDSSGALIKKSGAAGALGALPPEVKPGREQVLSVNTPRGPALLMVVPGLDGAVGALLHTDRKSVRVAPLVRLVALYTGLLGLGLLVFTYIVLTRIVVRPLDKLRLAAGNVAEGQRVLSVPQGGGRELTELGSSLARMTATIRAEEEAMRDKVAELKRATDQLKRARDTVIRSERLASVGRLAAGLAHEIGNPIAAILAFQELLAQSENLDEDERDFLARMTRETERVHRILRDLLDFARPAAASKASSEPEEPASTSVADAVEHVLQLVRPQQSFGGIEIISAVESGLPPVGMHPERVEQVLLNLLLNAADVVPAASGQINIGAIVGEERVRISIEDNGGGIDPVVRDQLFEPFVTTKEVGKGTGLGLAVCRGLVAAAGGSISVEDGSDGARFVLELPIVSSES